MPFFLESCRKNPDIDWKLFSDCGTPENLPSNVHMHTITFSDYCDFVSQKLNIHFSPADPYKLCDIKPAYGFLHADDLRRYDFWGFGDIDVIYGQLREWFTHEHLTRYDLFSSHIRRISGHLTLLRNTPRMHQLFQRIPNWQEKFCGPNEMLDEKAFTRVFQKRRNFTKPLFKFYNWFNPLWRKSCFREAYCFPGTNVRWTDGSFDFPHYWYWREGHLTNDRDGDRGFPYLHFMMYKHNEGWKNGSEELSREYQQIAQSGRWRISPEKGFSRLTDDSDL
jgi:hypothetical protein